MAPGGLAQSKLACDEDPELPDIAWEAVKDPAAAEAGPADGNVENGPAFSASGREWRPHMLDRCWTAAFEAGIFEEQTRRGAMAMGTGKSTTKTAKTARGYASKDQTVAALANIDKLPHKERRVHIAAARLRVTLDHRLKRETPPAVIAVAKRSLQPRSFRILAIIFPYRPCPLCPLIGQRQ